MKVVEVPGRVAEPAPAARWQRPVALALLPVLVVAAALAIQAGYAAVPQSIIVELLGYSMSLGDFALVLVRKLAVPALVLPIVFAVEAACCGWEDSSLRAILKRPSRSIRSDITMFLVIHSPLFRLARIVFTLGLVQIAGDVARIWLQQTTGLNLSLAGWPLVAMVPALLLVDTFLDYWAHRIQHSRHFWPVHRFHHAADEFCVLTADRIHPGDLPQLVFSFFLIGLFVVPEDVFLVYSTLIVALRYTIHSRIDTDFGWIGRWLVLSPGHHRAHHAYVNRASGNFALITLWDRLFGTLQPTVSRATPIGVERDYRHGYWTGADLVRDTIEMVREIVRPGDVQDRMVADSASVRKEG